MAVGSYIMSTYCYVVAISINNVIETKVLNLKLTCSSVFYINRT